MNNLIEHIEGEILEVLQTKESKDLDLKVHMEYKNGSVQVKFEENKKQQHYHHNTKDRRI